MKIIKVKNSIKTITVALTIALFGLVGFSNDASAKKSSGKRVSIRANSQPSWDDPAGATQKGRSDFCDALKQLGYMYYKRNETTGDQKMMLMHDWVLGTWVKRCR